MTIEENIALSGMTTLRVGGTARFFARVHTTDDLKEAHIFAQEKDIPFFILGGGSNTLVPDEGFPGIVIRMENKGIEIIDRDGYIQVIASAGEGWDSLVYNVVACGLSGIENLSYIPGTVGGAAVQNIGAYGVEAGDCIDWVEVFDTRTRTLKKFLQKECAFGYRVSIFKNIPALIVMRVAFNLARVSFPHLHYKEVHNYFIERKDIEPTLVNIREAIISIRTAKLPPPTLGTAGSFFKNPVVSNEVFLDLKKKFPDIKTYPVSADEIKLSVAWILENIGEFKGIRRGDAGVYDKHALVLVNYGNATAGNMLGLAREMKECVRERTGILLEEEVVMMK